MAPWIRIRIELYRQLENHVQHLLGQEGPELKAYRNQFDKEFQKLWKTSSREQLIDEIEKSDIVLLADFHALQQSQKAQLRILKASLIERPPVLAVEFFNQIHQKHIDQYVKGSLTEREFLKAVEWNESWGFPWENYRPILRFAQRQKIPVYGINRQFNGVSGKNLKSRDEFAAEQILKIRKGHPDRRVFVIYGDLHLASSHLPKSLQKKKSKKDHFRTLTVFQNNEKIYFKLLEKEEEVSVDVVRLSRDQFCVVSVPPWVKWQNYLLFLERHLDKELAGEAVEYTDHIGRFVNVLAEDFAVKIPSDHFSVYTPEDAKFWSALEAKFDSKHLRGFQQLVQDSKTFYVPELQIGYLARASVNHAAQLAMAIVHSHLSGWKVSPLSTADDFLKLIWLEAVQYLGSKMINPKRKTDTLHDIRAALASRHPRDLGQEALQLALHQKMKELLRLTGERARWTPYRPRKSASYREAARLLGGLLGEKLYTGLRKRMLSLPTLISLLKKPVDGPELGHFYFEITELVEGLPDPFLSKSEKM